ncbi:MAG TPA: ABC transporter permease subunit, partial [Burkholderiales bacterium]|nr:ABC transporter permease subunit [Burkholderiales bacterium]
MRARAVAIQVLLVAAVAFVVWLLASNTAQNLEARRIASGFGFLSREAGFEIGESPFLAYGAADSYARAILVGLVNTFRVALIGIVLATLLGTMLGLARLSRNWLLAKLAAVYVEVVRNVPLLVQLFFLYAVITENLPGPRAALNPLPGVFLSNRGIAFPVLAPHAAHAWMVLALALGVALA